MIAAIYARKSTDQAGAGDKSGEQRSKIQWFDNRSSPREGSSRMTSSRQECKPMDDEATLEIAPEHEENRRLRQQIRELGKEGGL
jgi:hypothetical protein